jgi:signal peptidase
VRFRPRQIGIVAIAAFLALALAGSLAPALGWRMDVVRSGSMSPAINVGDLAVTSPERPEDLAVGDVACYRTSDGSLVCHRVIAMDSASAIMVTKGDANEDADPYPVAYGDVEGKVELTAPYLGYVVNFLQGPLGWAVIVLLGVLIIVNEAKGENGKSDARGPKEGGE